MNGSINQQVLIPTPAHSTVPRNTTISSILSQNSSSSRLG